MSQYMYKEWKDILIGLISLIGGTVSQFCIPLLIGIILDIMVNPKPDKTLDWDAINFYCGWYIAIFVFSAFCTMVRGYTFNLMSEKIARSLRYDFLYFLLNKDVGFYDDNKSGELLSRLSGDT